MKRRTVCLYLDSSLLEEARKVAEAQGASLSELAEEALRLYLQLFDRGQLRAPRRTASGRPAAKAPTAAPPSLPSAPPPHQPPPAPPAQAQPPPQPPAPPHLQNNAWVAVLRSRR